MIFYSKITDEDIAKQWATEVALSIEQNLKFFIEQGWQDKQWFLDFKDELNKLSIDEDRPDTTPKFEYHITC